MLPRLRAADAGVGLAIIWLLALDSLDVQVFSPAPVHLFRIQEQVKPRRTRSARRHVSFTKSSRSAGLEGESVARRCDSRSCERGMDRFRHLGKLITDARMINRCQKHRLVDTETAVFPTAHAVDHFRPGPLLGQVQLENGISSGGQRPPHDELRQFQKTALAGELAAGEADSLRS